MKKVERVLSSAFPLASLLPIQPSATSSSAGRISCSTFLISRVRKLASAFRRRTAPTSRVWRSSRLSWTRRTCSA